MSALRKAVDASGQPDVKFIEFLGIFQSKTNVYERVDGAGCRSRTRDLMITNQLLYQLS